MLSFDITDRNIRIVKGVESNNKLKIQKAVTVDVEEGYIVNGHIRDVSSVALLLNKVIKMNKMADKEAIVSFSSNLTIFKEITVPKTKGQDLSKTVRLQMQGEFNLDDSYSIAHIIVGDAKSADEGESYKILATACPYEIVNSYRELFKFMEISLKSVMIGCNCITKVLLADSRIAAKMPLLAVQIDNNFISLNLYENNQLSFSRFASIDAADYNNSPDYVFEAVTENIFRMLQFHRTRNTGSIIENVVFYGDTHEFVRLTDELEKLDLRTSLINVPPMIHGHENLEFSLYANAIGAMFKRDKEKEKINLLETDLGTTIKNKVRDESAGNTAIIAFTAISILAVGGIYLGQTIKNNGILDDIQECEDYLNSEDTKGKIRLKNRLDDLKGTVNDYYTKMQNSSDAYNSKPVINGEKYDFLQDVLDKTQDELGLTEIAEGEEAVVFNIRNPKYEDDSILEKKLSFLEFNCKFGCGEKIPYIDLKKHLLKECPILEGNFELRNNFLSEKPHKNLIEIDFKRIRKNILFEFIKNLNEKQGYIKSMWCGDVECEDKLKDVTGGVKSRCIPFVEDKLSDVCVCCGKPAKKMVYWGKAY